MRAGGKASDDGAPDAVELNLACSNAVRECQIDAVPVTDPLGQNVHSGVEMVVASEFFDPRRQFR